jgi:hypothetical protein
LKQSDSNGHELLTLTRMAISTMVAWHLHFTPVALLAAGGFAFSAPAAKCRLILPACYSGQ